MGWHVGAGEAADAAGRVVSGVLLGWPLSTGGSEERYAGRLVDAAADAFDRARTWEAGAVGLFADAYGAQAAIDRARGRAFLDALALLRDDLTALDADRIYTEAAGRLPG